MKFQKIKNSLSDPFDRSCNAFSHEISQFTSDRSFFFLKVIYNVRMLHITYVSKFRHSEPDFWWSSFTLPNEFHCTHLVPQAWLDLIFLQTMLVESENVLDSLQIESRDHASPVNNSSLANMNGDAHFRLNTSYCRPSHSLHFQVYKSDIRYNMVFNSNVC